MSFTGYLFLALALIYTLLNGLNDSSNIVATIIFSRAMSPRMALSLTALAELCGPFLFGTAVARTIGAGIILPDLVTMPMLIAVLISAIIWNRISWYTGMPSSSSHALVGGLVGAAVAGTGFEAIQLGGLKMVLLALFLSPVLGFVIGYVFTGLVYLLARNATLRINWFFKRAQIFTGLTVALSQGANDGQKSMGIITLGLLASGVLSQFVVPVWAMAASAGMLSLGTAIGGWRLIRTLGGRFYKIRPVHGFCSQTASTGVLLIAALLGGPVSTTQVVSSAILGVGASERMSKVRWGVAGNIAMTWVITIPANALLAAVLYEIIHLL